MTIFHHFPGFYKLRKNTSSASITYQRQVSNLVTDNALKIGFTYEAKISKLFSVCQSATLFSKRLKKKFPTKKENLFLLVFSELPPSTRCGNHYKSFNWICLKIETIMMLCLTHRKGYTYYTVTNTRCLVCKSHRVNIQSEHCPLTLLTEGPFIPPPIFHSSRVNIFLSPVSFFPLQPWNERAYSPFPYAHTHSLTLHPISLPSVPLTHAWTDESNSFHLPLFSPHPVCASNQVLAALG